MSSGSSDGRQGAASPQAPAASSPLTAEDAERFASVLKPMWELDSAPQPAAPLAPPSKPRVATPIVTVKARQPNAPVVAPTSRDSSHEFDDLAQLPRGPSAAPGALNAFTAPIPAPIPAPVPELELEPEGASAVAVQPHLPPRRQQISEPRHSVEVDAPPPQTVPSPFAHAAPGAAGSTGAMAQAAYGGPTVEQLRARAARSQPTMVLNKSEVSFPGRRRNRRAVVIGLGVLVLGGGVAAALFVTSARTAAAGATASSSAASAMTAASTSPTSPSGQATVAATVPAAADTSGTPTRTGAIGTAAAPGATATTAASPASSSAITNTGTGSTTAGSTHPAATGATKAAPVKHKTPGTIVRSSPF